jgi:hypothetical protein
MQAKVHGAANVPKNTLHQGEVRGARSMHVYADLLHNIGDVRARESKVLKATSQTLVLHAIGKQITITRRKLGMSVDGGSRTSDTQTCQPAE